MYRDLTHALTRASSTSSHDVVLFDHDGKYFTTGVNFVDQFENLADTSYDVPAIYNLPAYVFMKTVIESPLLLVSTIRGPSIGIGATFLLHCDYVLASRNPKGYLWFPFARACLPPEFSSSTLLPERAGRTMATDMLLLGSRISFVEAADIGLLKLAPSKDSDPKSLMVETLRKAFEANHGYGKTVRNYVKLTRLRRKDEMKEAAVRELDCIRERIKAGDVEKAAMEVMSKL